jgi:osmotically inducible protein OsmC
MPLVERTAAVTWTGDLRTGGGTLQVGSGALPDVRVTFSSRAEAPQGLTSPEELLAAAHAICYAMALSHVLTQAGHRPEQLKVTATCAWDPAALRITRMNLQVRAQAPGLESHRLQELAQQAEQICPVSNALRGNVEIVLEV